MIRGLYTSGWSMMANSKKMDVISNNLANVNTNAYKKDTVIFESFPNVLTRRLNDFRSNSDPSGAIGTMELGHDVGEIFTYRTQGQLVKTSSSLDLAIKDSENAYFTVSVPGQNGALTEYYTRDGAFTTNSLNELVTKEGYAVMGEDGPVVLNGPDFSVDADVYILQDGEALGRLRITQFQDGTTLRKYGANLSQAMPQSVQVPFTGVVEQGFIEQSNVNIIKEMVDMISVMRSYEANQKVLQAQDSTLEKAVTEVGALR